MGTPIIDTKTVLRRTISASVHALDGLLDSVRKFSGEDN